MSKFLIQAKEYAISKGGECLSTEYISAKSPLTWKCNNQAHKSWSTLAYSMIKKGSWCPECREETSNNSHSDKFLKKAQEYAKKQNGTLISTEFISAKTKMEWKCHQEHHKSFFSTLDHCANRNRWCPECRINNPSWSTNKDIALQIAKDNGGIVIFPKGVELIKTSTMLTLKCSNHEHKSWKSSWRNICELKTWCPECAGIFTPEEFVQKAHKFAKEQGGRCLTDSYQDQHTLFYFKCSVLEHKEFNGEYRRIFSTWCKECKKISAPVLAYKEKKLQEAKEHAKSRGGECLSTEFTTTDEHLIWKCHEGHTWNAKFSNVTGTLQRWCPECSNKSYKETMSRYLLEKLLGFSLPKCNPSWNTNPKTNRKLELDGYNEKNQFAFEFQGEQHFKKNAFFKTNHEKFEELQQRDLQKKINCKNNDVFLLEIFDIDIKNIHCLTKKIIELLEQHNISYDKKIDITSLKKDTVYATNTTKQQDFLEKAKNYATSRGGNCLSSIYINAHSKLEWKCKNENHPSWFAPITIMSRSNWCWKCYIKA
jgi:hypothetical protein